MKSQTKLNKIFFFLFLIALVSLIHIIFAKKNLEMGFFTDDWLFTSVYRAYVANPITDILQAWKAIGSHNFAHSYYIGVLYNFFGFDFTAYRILNQILKVLATLSLYPLVMTIFKRRFLAFLSTLIYGIHFSTYGMLDGPSRGGDFLAIISMNLFLFTYIQLLRKNSTKIIILFALAFWLSGTILLDATRLFPLIIAIPILEISYLIYHKPKIKLLLIKLKNSLIRLFVLNSPFILVFIFAPNAILPQLSYSIGIYEKITQGNWQLLLTPLASFGSTFITRDVWPFFGQANYHTFSSYLFFMAGLMLFFFIFNTGVALLTSVSFRFVRRTLFLNLILGLLVFWLSNHWLNLSSKIAAPVDPGTYLTPSIIGLFFFSTSLSFYKEWRNTKGRSLLHLGIFASSVFSLLFIFLTWIFADYNSIFLGVHPYLGIPSIGSSILIAILLVLAYDRLTHIPSSPIKKIFVYFLIVSTLGMFSWLSYKSIDQYFSYWLNNGMRITDQQRIINKFWSYVDFNKKSIEDVPPLIYLDSSEDFANGTFYGVLMVWNVAAWFDLKYKQPKEGRYSLCEIVIIDKSDLENLVILNDNGKKVITRSKCGVPRTYQLENFYAFKLKNRDIHPITKEVLKQLRVE